jgi:hypothetical protein
MPGPLVVSNHVILEGGLFAFKDLVHTATLSGALTLDDTYPSILKLDPGGAHRNVTLDPEPTSEGLTRWIFNAADNAENLVLLNDADSPATIATVSQNDSALVVCNGTSWSLVAIIPINLS